MHYSTLGSLLNEKLALNENVNTADYNDIWKSLKSMYGDNKVGAGRSGESSTFSP